METIGKNVLNQHHFCNARFLFSQIICHDGSNILIGLSAG